MSIAFNTAYYAIPEIRLPYSSRLGETLEQLRALNGSRRWLDAARFGHDYRGTKGGNAVNATLLSITEEINAFLEDESGWRYEEVKQFMEGVAVRLFFFVSLAGVVALIFSAVYFNDDVPRGFTTLLIVVGFVPVLSLGSFSLSMARTTKARMEKATLLLRMSEGRLSGLVEYGRRHLKP